MKRMSEKRAEYLATAEQYDEGAEVKHRDPVKEVGFAAIDHVVTLDTKLSDGAYRTYATLYYFWKSKKVMWASTKTIAELRNLKESTIRQHVRELMDCKLVSRTRRIGQSSLIYIENPPQEYIDAAIIILEQQRASNASKNRAPTMEKPTLNVSQNREVKENQEGESLKDGDSKTESQPSDIHPCGHPVSAIASDREGTNYCTMCAAESARNEFDAMPSASDGMKPREHTAETADPLIAEREFVKRYSPVFAEILGRIGAISEDKQAAKRAFSKHFDIERMNSRLDAYLSGEVIDFKKNEATAFWIVSRLEKDLAKKRVLEDRSEEIKRRALSQ